jgi:hypothetical protein
MRRNAAAMAPKTLGRDFMLRTVDDSRPPGGFDGWSFVKPSLPRKDSGLTLRQIAAATRAPRCTEMWTVRFADSKARESMTTIQAIFFGLMLAWTPCLILFAFLLWREEARRAANRKAQLKSLFSGHGDNQPPYSDAQQSNTAAH